jgi:beta-glucosidase
LLLAASKCSGSVFPLSEADWQQPHGGCHRRCVGLTSDLEGEEMKVELEGFSGGDQTSIDLPTDLRASRSGEGDRQTAVVLMNGSTLDLSWAKERASAIIEAWYPGQAGGCRGQCHRRQGQIGPAACL